MITPEMITPYGGKLVNLLVDEPERQALQAHAAQLPSLTLPPRAICDLEMLAVGAFSPLDRFMGKRDYKCVLNESRLASGQLFPIPVTLSVALRPEIRVGEDVALRDQRNNLLAVMTIHEMYPWDWQFEASRVFGTTDLRHPAVAEMQRMGKGTRKVNLSGPLRVLQLPPQQDYPELRMTPAATRAQIAQAGHANVIAFLAHTPLRRAQAAWLQCVIDEMDGTLLLHAGMGITNQDGRDHARQMSSYLAFMEHDCDPGRIRLALLPLTMRMAGPREAVWHMLIQRNYGANHLIIGRDYAGAGHDARGKPFYGPNDAQEVALLYGRELEMQVVPAQQEDGAGHGTSAGMWLPSRVGWGYGEPSAASGWA